MYSGIIPAVHEWAFITATATGATSAPISVPVMVPKTAIGPMASAYHVAASPWRSKTINSKKPVSVGTTNPMSAPTIALRARLIDGRPMTGVPTPARTSEGIRKAACQRIDLCIPSGMALARNANMNVRNAGI